MSTELKHDLENKASYLPSRPGVYLFKDGKGKIIYVGKAISLKNRVRSYFQTRGVSPKVRALMNRARDLEYIVTDSELEALILELNLIKGHRPRYNIYLKDDKSYPYLRVTLTEDYPRVFVTRKIVKDGSRYYGPYTKVGAVNETLRLLKRLFPLRTCKQKNLVTKSRPCLNYHIKKCLAPCCGEVSKEEYRAMIDEVCLFLEGRQDELVKNLMRRMGEAAKNLQFEKAAKLRDQLAAVEDVLERQKIVSDSRDDTDVIGMAKGGRETCVTTFFVRKGKLIGRDKFWLKGENEDSEDELLPAFLKQHYSRVDYIPREILLPFPIGDAPVIEKWLSGLCNHRVYLKVPRRGDKRRLVEMATKNAELALGELEAIRADKLKNTDLALSQLAGYLGLKDIPKRIECYDISNIQGAQTVASMVVFENGQPYKDGYRKFRIRSTSGPDDFAAMKEVISRRLNRADVEKKLIDTGQLSTKKAGFYRLPDLLIVDGGKGQLSAVREVMGNMGYDYIPTFALAEKEELLFSETGPDPVSIPRDSQALYLLQRLRDEAHRFALGYHRQLRGKASLKSLLDEIEGVGVKRRKALLENFGSLEGIRRASLEELAQVPGMNRKVAGAVREFFKD